MHLVLNAKLFLLDEVVFDIFVVGELLVQTKPGRQVVQDTATPGDLRLLYGTALTCLEYYCKEVRRDSTNLIMNIPLPIIVRIICDDECG